MIENLTVENYRSFENYSMNNLKRVNLLTGLNNSGKTSLLEAVEIFVSRADSNSIIRIAKRRGEYTRLVNDLQDDERLIPSFSHFIFGHSTSNGAGFTLQINDSDQLATRIVNFEDHQIVDVSLNDEQIVGTEFVITRNGGIRDADRAYSTSRTTTHGQLDSECLFLGSSSLGMQRLRILWNRMVELGTDRLLRDAMKTIDPDIRDVQLRPNGSRFGEASESFSDVLIGYEDQPTRIPLGTNGEGVRRMLAFAVALSSVPGGILLVDEIDTGLHYSVLADMWKLVIGTAIKNDIQVFATTHSFDCLRGLNEACERNPEYASEISLQTIDRSLNCSISGDANDLKSAMNLGVEVR